MSETKKIVLGINKHDIEFLSRNTRYDEEQIIEWFRYEESGILVFYPCLLLQWLPGGLPQWQAEEEPGAGSVLHADAGW